MITNKPTRPGVYYFWPTGTDTDPARAVIVALRRDKLGALLAVGPDGVEMSAEQMQGHWEFLPETPLERKVFRRRR